MAPLPNGEKIVKPDHAAAFSALLFALPTEGGQKYPWRRQVGQGTSPSSSPLPFLRCLPNFPCPEVNLLSFQTPGRATDEITVTPDQPPARAKA